MTDRFTDEMTATHEAWADVVAECKKAGVTAWPEWLGGGCICLRIPLSEDGLRFVWLGCDDDGTEPLHIWRRGPERFMGGCAYIYGNADGDDCRQAPLEDQETDPTDPTAIAATIRAMVTAAMAIPDKEYTSI